LLWLAIGLAFEPFEGGIKKDRATLSYYFVTSGLAVFTLVALMVLIESQKLRVGFRLMIATGQNPLVAYAGVHGLLTPLLGLTGLGALVAQWTSTPWLGALRGWVYTVLISAVGAWCTKRGWWLRT
jgi:predicted acyltransferase